MSSSPVKTPTYAETPHHDDHIFRALRADSRQGGAVRRWTRAVWGAFVAFAATACASTAATAPPPAVYVAPEGNLPFSTAVRAGPMIYLAGQIGTTSMSPPTLIAGGIEAETRQALENIKSVLEKNGATLDDIVKCTVMMADMREWAAMNTVYASYFAKHKPARSSFGTSGLALGARVEVECAAYRP
jgi:2-iminobutanoate/2-iminopropanoate deaminase